MTEKMRAAVLYDVEDIRIEQRSIPNPGPGELLVQTRASGICTGDVMAWYVRRKAPLVLGHEPAGVVVATGEGVAEFSPGDRVFVHHHAPCFDCRACARGDYVQCATWRKTSIDPGGLAEFFRVPAANVRDTLRLPNEMSFVDASLIEPLACVVKSLRRSGVREGDSLHIIGLGVMGLMHALVALARGARVSGSDFLEERRTRAAQLGVEAVHPDSGSTGADVVICGPGSPEALRNAIAAAAPGGTVVMFTPLEPGIPFTFDPNDLYFRDVKLVPSYSCGPPDTRDALDLIARGVVTADRLGATLYPLEEAPQAYAALRSAQVIKPIVTFEPSLFQ
ncbi:MAG TPA: alcohol dehydrogenase catalytic domain-containing protein [Candidatus Baltobacteraceae bacterium]|jgi:L-iditol 2-dehydrogenase|nr:alcohol dehydrogenase catalytic domain-containing protein [Candidatus Baltobacteraceae bacterium]